MSYHLFYMTGRQDCENALDVTDFDIEKIAESRDPAREARRQANELLEDADVEQIEELAEDYDNISKAQAVASWKHGWVDKATDILSAVARGWKEG